MSESTFQFHEQLVKLMPSNVNYKIKDHDDSVNGFKATIRLECATADACDQWVSEFCRLSLCTWRLRSTYPQGRRGLLYRKDYVCQHSNFNKDHPIRQKTKDTGCSAKFSIKV